MSERKLPVYHKIAGLHFSNYFLPDFVRGALAYKPKKGDLFIVTYPKCGTTWTQHIVFLILNRGKPADDYATYSARTPFLEMMGPEAVDQMPGPGAIKTHLPFHLQPYSPEAKYIYIARNPKDCVVSYYHHHKNMPGYEFGDGEFDTFFDLFITGQNEFGDYFDHLLSWYEHRDDPNVLFLTYEDMKMNTRAAVLKLAYFIGEEHGKLLDSNEEMLQNVIQYSSLDHMKKTVNTFQRKSDNDLRNVPKDKLPKAFQAMVDTGNPEICKPMTGDFIRKGIIGDWRSHFSEEQNQLMNEWIAKRTTSTDVMKLWENFPEIQ